jgi:hypothetical protein
LFSLVASFSIHIIIVIFYISSRSKRLFNWFITTSITNMAFAIALSIYALSRPELIRGLNLKFILWVLSGFVMVILLFVKINVLRSVYNRRNDPSCFHYNYFGKKVYESGIIKKHEFLSFLASFPFFLIIGAYFVARLINMVLYGHI